MKKIIITGVPRTGTTALAGLLSHSTNILTFNELGIFDYNSGNYHKRKNTLLKDSTNARFLELKNLNVKDIDDFVAGDFRNKGNIEFLGDKFPTYCVDAKYCRHFVENYSDAYFIFTYRSPCATIYSGIKRSKIEKDEKADWYFKDLNESTERLINQTVNWSTAIYPNVKNKIIINYDHYVNNVNLLINDLNLFLNTKLDVHKPEKLYCHLNPNAYKDVLNKEEIEYINNKTRPVELYVQKLISNQQNLAS
jgi:hypothetical protein